MAVAQSAPCRSVRRTRTMLLPLLCLLAGAAASPVLYDRRQDGDLNVSADVQNVVLLVAYPQKMSVPLDILDFLKSNKGTREQGMQDRADHVMESFVEPNTPYQVEIGSRAAEDARAVEVVIAGRRRLEADAQADGEELKLIGATEQCGPDRERDPVTLTCRLRSQLDIEIDPQPEQQLITIQTPEVVPS